MGDIAVAVLLVYVYGREQRLVRAYVRGRFADFEIVVRKSMERVTVELLYELPLAVFDEASDSRGTPVPTK